MKKGVVSLQAALAGDDQLRQRVAWALAQIFVVGVEGVSKARRDACHTRVTTRQRDSGGDGSHDGRPARIKSENVGM